jgi:hypothetical protein
MKKPESAQHARKPSRLRLHNRLRRLHRWFGLASLVFILVLSLTGLGLNHTEQWRLDTRYLDAGWLLAWYGFDAPEPAASFAVGEARVTLVGNRLYLGVEEALRGVDELVAAISRDGHYVAATPESLLYLSAGGELLDRLELGTSLPRPIESIAADETGLLVRSAGRTYALDERTLDVEARGDARVVWPEASPVPAHIGRGIAEAYRGPGVSIERLLLDLHNGNLFARAGGWLLDAAGILLVVLSVTGLVLWMKQRG